MYLYLGQVGAGDKVGQVLGPRALCKVGAQTRVKDAPHLARLANALHLGGDGIQRQGIAARENHSLRGEPELARRVVQQLGGRAQDAVFEQAGSRRHGAPDPVGATRGALDAAVERAGRVGIDQAQAPQRQAQRLGGQLGHHRRRALSIVRGREQDGDSAIQAQLGLGLAGDGARFAETIPHAGQSGAPPPGAR